MVNCPVCGASRVEGFFECRDGVPVSRCKACSHFFVDYQALAPGFLDALYADHYSGFRDDPVFSRAVRDFVDHDLKSRVPPPAKVLDVGCGNGEFMRAAKDAGYDVEGLDTSEAAVALCRERGLKATQGTLASFAPGERYRIITLWDVIEHVTEPLEVLRSARKLLEPGGLLFIKTPSITMRAVYGVRAVPRLAGSILALPAHVQLFRASTLSIVLRRAGFSEIETTELGRTRGGSSGGSLPKRLKRLAARGIQEAVGNANLSVFARA